MAERKPLIAGNWKMHGTAADGCRLALEVARSWDGSATGKC